MRRLRMLAACEMSGRVRDAFAGRGWEAWSADLLPSERPGWTEVEWPSEEAKGSARHYQGDCRDLFNWSHPVNRAAQMTLHGYPWDLVIAFPPCTHLSLAGARYWKEKRADGRQDAAAAFFMEMAGAPAPHVAVENPRGDMTRRWRAPDQYVQPWWFGDPLVKQTGLWLVNLPPLLREHDIWEYPELARVATGGGSYRVDIRAGRGPNNTHEDGKGRAYRSVMRALTPPGLAAAMAGQWGSCIEEEAA